MIRVLLLLTPLLGTSCGSHILVFFPGPSDSVLVGFTPLFLELSHRGHTLSVITAHDLPALKGTTITQIVIEQPLTSNAVEEVSRLPFQVRYWDLALTGCDKLLKNPKVVELIKSSKKFNLFIGSPFCFMECTIAIAHQLKIPVVNIFPNRMTTHLSHSVGFSFPSTYVAEPLLPFSNNMNVLQRISNTFFLLGYSFGVSYYYIPKMDAIVREHFPNLPPLQEMLARIPVTLLNTNLALHPAQPLPTGIVPVGGLTILQKTHLSSTLKNWLDSADQGVVLVSLGRDLHTKAESPEVRLMMAVFANLPQKVVIQWESDIINDKPKNVKFMKWIPQAAVLAHPNCRLLVTRGGLHSWMEAVHYSVPLLGVLPCHPDQAHNLAELQERGHGLHFTGPWTDTAFLTAVKEVLHNSKYKDNIQEASKVFWDQPMNPLQTAVFWTEYVIRHKGAPHLVSAASMMPWYQVMLLDVVAAIVFVFVLGLLVIQSVLGWIKWSLIDYEYIIFNYMLRTFDKINRLFGN